MKTIALASAAILAAGTVFADQVQVVVDPGANISVHRFQYAPALTVGDDQGMLSADAVMVDPDAVPVSISSDLPPGFEPDALIYIWDNDGNGINTVIPINID